MKKRLSTPKHLIIRAILVTLISCMILVYQPQWIIASRYTGFYFSACLILLLCSPFAWRRLGEAPIKPLRNMMIIFFLPLLYLVYFLGLIQIYIFELVPSPKIDLAEKKQQLIMILQQLHTMQPASILILVAIAWAFFTFVRHKPGIIRFCYEPILGNRVLLSSGNWVVHYFAHSYMFCINIVLVSAILLIAKTTLHLLGVPFLSGLEFSSLLICSIILLPSSSPLARKWIRRLTVNRTPLGILFSGYTVITLSLLLLVNIVLHLLTTHTALSTLRQTNNHLALHSWSLSITLFSWSFWIITLPLIASVIARFCQGLRVYQIILLGALPSSLLCGTALHVLEPTQLGNWFAQANHLYFGFACIIITMFILLLALMLYRDISFYHTAFMHDPTNTKIRRLLSVSNMQLNLPNFLIIVFVLNGIHFLHMLTTMIALPIFVLLLFIPICLFMALYRNKTDE